jgi:hypothetical protein
MGSYLLPGFSQLLGLILHTLGLKQPVGYTIKNIAWVKTMSNKWFVKEDGHGIFIGAKPMGVYIRRGHVELGNYFKEIVGKPSEDYDQLA